MIHAAIVGLMIEHDERHNFKIVDGLPVLRDKTIALSFGEPEISAKVIEMEAEAGAQKAKEAYKMNCDYNGVSISLTKDDALGLMQVKTAFELGITETIFRFKNGTVMPLTAESFTTLAQFFAEKRNSLFAG